jgi:hypothetical protein
MRADTVLLAHAFFGLHDGDLVVARIAFYPSPIFGGALRQDLRSDGIQSVYVAKEMHDVLGPGEQWQVSLDDDSVETVIYKNQEAFKELRKGFHRSPPSDVWSLNQNHLSWRPVESTT